MTHHHHHHHHHHDHGTPAGRLGLVIVLNVIITVAEYVAGVLSGSLALISDAGHNFSDVLALLLGYAGEKVSRRKPSARYSFGLRRFEVLVALINALTLIGIGIFIVVEAVERFHDPVTIDPGILIPVAALGLAGNFISMALLHKDRERSLNMKAAFLHLLYDTLSSAAVVAVGVLLLFKPWFWLDLVISLGIVGMIVYSSAGILTESLRVFMQAAPESVNPKTIHNDLLSIEDISAVHGLHIWSVSSREVFLSCHLCTPQPLDDPNDLIQRVNDMLAQDHGIAHTTLQIETGDRCPRPFDPEDDGCCRD